VTSSRHRSLLLALFLGIGLVLTTACSRDSSTKGDLVSIVSGAVGLQEEAAKPAEMLDIVIDASDGSPGSITTVETTLTSVLTYAADRPGSVIRLWALGLELSDTRLLASVQSTAPKRRGERARKNEATRFIDASLPYLLQAARPIFDHPAKKQSPIAEGISRVAYSRAPAGMHRQIITITDARQVGGQLKLDFECDKKLPKVEAFVADLHKQAMLTPDSLRDTDVHFAYVALGAIPKRGCQVTLARAQHIESMWRAAFTAAGATSVEFTTDEPRLKASTPVGGAS
jgi:hypothetical protein